MSENQRSIAPLLAISVSTLVALFLGGCEEKLPQEVYDENWHIAGVLASKHRTDDWIAVLEFPQKKITRITPYGLPAPYGDDWAYGPVGPIWLAYNGAAKVVVCVDYENYPERPFSADVWIYDLQTSKNTWIGRNRWRDISNFGWSEDGRKVAFMGTDIPETSESRRKAEVYVYDLTENKLITLADDGAIERGHMYSCPPVWSKDGKYLYYASIGQDVMRIDLSTGKKEKLPRPDSAFMLLTVRRDDIVYIRQLHMTGDKKFELQIVKLNLQSEEDTQATVLYEPRVFYEVVISPSRRFILLRDRRSYWGGPRVLIDVETGKTYESAQSYIPQQPNEFNVMSTCPAGN